MVIIVAHIRDTLLFRRHENGGYEKKKKLGTKSDKERGQREIWSETRAR